MSRKRKTGPDPKVSLRTMARRMNVAVSTVSRALAGDRGVSEARAEEIRRLAQQLGYRPRPLRRKRTNAIALLIATDKPGGADDVYQNLVVLNVERRASARGRHVHVEFLPRDPQRLVWPAILAEHRVDGVVLTGHPPRRLCDAVRGEGIPAAVVEDTVARTGCSCVLTNFASGTSSAIRRLIRMGHRQIALVVSGRQFPSVEMRYQAYYRTMQEAGIEPAPNWVIEGIEPSVWGGRSAVAHYMENGCLPTAIVFTSDWMALGGLNELTRRALRVPEDVSIVGHDNISICQQLSPSLTSVDGHVEEVVALAVDLLEGQMAGDQTEPMQKEVESDLVWRESCGPAPTTVY